MAKPRGEGPYSGSNLPRGTRSTDDAGNPVEPKRQVDPDSTRKRDGGYSNALDKSSFGAGSVTTPVYRPYAKKYVGG